MGDWLLNLRNTALVDSAYRRIRNATSGPGWGGFHRDRVYRAMMLDLLEAIPFTSFVETGTYRGYSTELIASQHPKLPVFTVEVLESTYQRSARALRKYPNITALLGSSDKTVEKLIAGEMLGDLPLFYLDAHWQTYWPLRGELRAIGAAGGKAVIVIDDFEVPGEPRFGFDIDGGGDRTAGDACNLDYIRPALSPAARYHAMFPKYMPDDAFGAGATGALRGHIVLFQKLANEYTAQLARTRSQLHYRGSGLIATS